MRSELEPKVGATGLGARDVLHSERLDDEYKLTFGNSLLSMVSIFIIDHFGLVLIFNL